MCEVKAMLSCGIVGLPLSGKSTVFNVITRAGAEVKPYAGGKTDPNRAVVSVPDPRFDRLVEIWQPKKATPAPVEFVDLAGLSRDASKGAGLGNSFLSSWRTPTPWSTWSGASTTPTYRTPRRPLTP